MSAHLDHIVIFVSDLSQAVRDFEDLGFSVTPGGTHGRTENALICFPDQTYIELLALKRDWRRPLIRLAARVGLLERAAMKKPDMYWRLLRWISGDTGLVDWCVRPGSVSATLEHWTACGVPVIQAEPFERARPDGKIVKWYLGAPKDFDLPFLIEDITPIELRIPGTDATQHANGADGIASLIISVEDVSATTTLFETLNLLDERQQIGETKIHLKPYSPGHSKLALNLYSDGGRQELDIKACHGATIQLTPREP